jgi:hypothetical protein
MEIVNEVKDQYASILETKDSNWFKKVAEYYLEVAARLRTRNIMKHESNITPLLLRNAQKRLYLGIGCELLLKAFYLKEGYCINKFKGAFAQSKVPTHKLATLNRSDINKNDTFTLGDLINSLSNVGITDPQIKRGFMIAMVFRNKEGHITSQKHEFDEKNYREIEKAIIDFYRVGFGQDVSFSIAMKSSDEPEFRINT